MEDKAMALGARPDEQGADVARSIAMGAAMRAVEAFGFKEALSKAGGPGSWASLREPAILAVVEAARAGLGALRSIGAFDGSAAPTSSDGWGVVEIAGGPSLGVGQGRARVDFMPAVVRIHPSDTEEVAAPGPRDPRFGSHLLAFATTTLFRRAGAALLARRAAKGLMADWIEEQLPFALEGRGPLAGLAALAERSVLGMAARAPSGTSAPKANRL